MQRLIDQVYGRSIAVFCQGPSVGELTQDECEAMRRAGVVIAAVNRFWLLDTVPDILWVGAHKRIEEGHNCIYFWLRDDPGRLLLTRPKALELFQQYEPIDQPSVRRQIIPFICEEGPETPDAVHLFTPVSWEVISIAAMVLALHKAGADRIGVFGHDGGTSYVKGLDLAHTVDRDIDALNNRWPRLCRAAGVFNKDIRVRTGNPESRCICWPKCTKQELVRWLIN